MSQPEVTILIPNYRTLQITTLCLRLLRKHTDKDRVRVIVIDNNSNDDSVRYLRELRWIQLIERVPQPNESGPLSHARALDEGMSGVSTPYVLSMHTDTLVMRPDWLNVFLQPLQECPEVAGVGSWKLEPKSLIGGMWSAVATRLQRIVHRRGQKIGGHADQDRYLRSHSALYRTELLTKHRLTFSECGTYMPVGQMLHKKLVGCGYTMVFLRPEVLNRYICHLGHATMVLNPELGARRSTVSKGLRRMKRMLEELNADQILSDDSLDK